MVIYRSSGPIIYPTKLLPAGFRVIDTCPGPGYLNPVMGRVDSESGTGDFRPSEIILFPDLNMRRFS
jgi:hypothetical protein